MVDIGNEKQCTADGMTSAVEEMPLAWVEADPSWNCRAPYVEAEVQGAVERYRHEPMLHPPSVVRLGERRFQLVTGFLRFEVMRRLGDELGWFRVVEGDEEDRLLWNLGENTARRDLTGYELVERVWMLHSRGVSKPRLLRACGFKIRYLNRLLFIRRRAHPELYEAFRTNPSLSVARMARLCTHEPAEQVGPEDSVDVGPGIVVSTSNEQLRELAARPPRDLRFVMGYSGWGAGQLESELAEGTWLTADAQPDIVFHTRPEGMWEAAIGSLGINPTTLVPGSGIH